MSRPNERLHPGDGHDQICQKRDRRPTGCPLSGLMISSRRLDRRTTVGALITALVASNVVLAPAAAPTETGALAAPRSRRSPDACGQTSWWVGSTEVCNGTFVYHDSVYDDAGADTTARSQSTYGTFAASKGDVRYAEYALDENVADLLTLELTPDGADLVVEARLNTVFDTNSAYLALALDTDGGDNPVAWGDGLVASAALTGPVALSAAGVDETHVFDTADPETNTITGRFPRPASDQFRLWAVTGIVGGPVTNVAFRGPYETGPWFEERQAAALATGDITDFAAAVDLSTLDVDRRFTPEPGHLYVRVHTSSATLDRGDGVREGVSYDGVDGRLQNGAPSTRQNFQFFGRHQPYAVYLPDTEGPYGLQFTLHGNGGSHSQIIEGDGAQQALGDDLGRVLFGPLARGTQSMYSDIAELDVIEAWDDLLTVVDIDADRVFAGGYSMGGYGSYRLVGLYPDRFAGLIVWVGPTGHGLNGIGLGTSGNNTSGYVGNVSQFWSNLLHTPAALLYGAADELVPVDQALLVQRTFADLALPHRFYLHAGDHVTLAVLDDWMKEAAYTARLTRVTQPARVSYRVEPRVGNSELGLAHDRAYWVSELVAHRTGYLDYAEVDLTSGGCSIGLPVVTRTGTYTTGTDPVPWVAQEFAESSRVAAPPGLTGRIANVASLEIDTSATGACLGGTFAYDVEAADAATVTLSDGRTIDLVVGRNIGSVEAPPAPDGDAGFGGVALCHEPGTSAERTKSVPPEAVAGHVGHGDTMGPCE